MLRLALLLALISLTRFANAYPIGSDIRWDFVGVVHYGGDFSACCSPELPEGSLVTGSFVFSYVPGTPMVSYSGSARIGSGTTIGAGGFAPIENHPSNQGTDSLQVFYQPPLPRPPFLGLQPGWGLGTALPGASFSLVDLDGVAFAFNPRTNDYIPDYAPDISVFETARVSAYYDFGHYPPGATSPDSTTQVSILVDVLYFVPEPAPVTLALASLAALVGLRSSAAAARTGRRSSARRSRGARVTRY